MIVFITFLCFLASSCYARPNNINPQNVVTVPTNCPEGQEWVNGACREIWRVSFAPANLVTVPTNCPPGQSFINGQCRDVWNRNLIEESDLSEIQPNYADVSPKNVVTVPTNCPEGQEWVNGQCRDVWRREIQPNHEDVSPKNVVSVPANCRPGQQLINGFCRDIWRSGTNTKNVITVPTNCSAGQEWVNGQCRDVWRSLQTINMDLNMDSQGGQVENYEQRKDDRNVISVPNQCPAGYRPDALGYCRPIF